jgi:hypothetical protein
VVGACEVQMKSSFIIFSHLNLKADNNVISDEWLKHRLGLFEHVTLKSLRQQTDMDFLYVLACAHDTPRDYRRHIKKLMPENSQLLLVSPEQTNYPCNNSGVLMGPSGTELLRPYIQADGHGAIYTTHIGTDDALARDYVEQIKAAYDWGYYGYHGFINHTCGYVCFSRTRTFNLIDDQKYFFLTLREPVEKFRGVLYTDHSNLHRRAPVIRPPGIGPMWVKVIHEHNIGNYSQWSHSFRKMTVEEGAGHGRVLKRFDLNIEKITPCST